MKIWISDTQNATHRIVKLNCEEHSGHSYLGDLDDSGLQNFFLELQGEIDIQKSIKLIKYYGYLHLFLKHSK